MFHPELLKNCSPIKVSMVKETKFRSVLKSVTWRFCATATTFSLVFIFTGKLDTAIKVGGIEVFLKMLIYFLHERVWGKVRFGKHEVQPFVIWITGLSSSGKTVLAERIIEKLNAKDLRTEHLDGKTIRHLFPSTGFTKTEVNEHIKRVGLLASRLESKGVFVVASFISPYEESREFVRELCRNFIEVYVSTPIAVCEKWDRKNLYKKARKGEIKNLPGVDVHYETPKNPNLTLDLSIQDLDESAEKVMRFIKKYL